MQGVTLTATLIGTILAFALGAVWYGPFFGNAFAGFSIATNYLFERANLGLRRTNAGYHTVRFALVGAAFGLLG